MVKDLAENEVKEGDWTTYNFGAPSGRGMIESIRPIFERGQYQGGQEIVIRQEIIFLIPAGHTGCPVMLVVPNEKEKAESQAHLANKKKPALADR